jgi:hypothetical protein
MASFWDTMFDSVDYHTRQAINEAAEQMQMVHDSVADHHTQQLRKLYSLDRAQERQIERLNVCVQVLFDALMDLGVDGHAIKAKVEDKLGAMESARNGPPQAVNPGAAHPYRGGGSAQGAPAAKPEPSGTCVRCRQTVLLRLTNFMEEGMVCDRCHWPTPG